MSRAEEWGWGEVTSGQAPAPSHGCPPLSVCTPHPLLSFPGSVARLPDHMKHRVGALFCSLNRAWRTVGDQAAVDEQGG